VIAAEARAAFNIRFNTHWTLETLKAELMRRLTAAAGSDRLRGADRPPVAFDIEWKAGPSDVFLTRDDTLIATLSASIKAVAGRTPILSTTGGTSDARFIKDFCPVVEFGLVGQTMHMVDERVAVADLEGLTAIYERFIVDWFGRQAA
jgi:succinyl-diaminopimelate desuccinylase